MCRYEARERDEISLEEGDVVESVVNEGGGWGKGRNSRTGAFGTFPMSFVEFS
jgi:N-methylhydantoinase B/oxoprolinase/acetone carboxylase alpha subunit